MRVFVIIAMVESYSKGLAVLVTNGMYNAMLLTDDDLSNGMTHDAWSCVVVYLVVSSHDDLVLIFNGLAVSKLQVNVKL